MISLKRTSKRETKINRVMTRMVFILMVATIFVLAVPINVSAATITVPDDYPTIQQAINAAIAGDTVYVRAGTYYEHLTIDKSLTLQGEDRDNTIIDAGGSGNAIYVTYDYVTIKGVTTANGECGIYLIPNWSINHIVISDCIATLNTHGIRGNHVGGYITIENCEISQNDGMGIYSHQFRNSVIKNCKVFENGYDPSQPYRVGIDIAWCSDSSIVDCDVYSNNVTGIVLDSTWECIVEGCNVRDNEGDGIHVWRWGYGYNNTVRNNVVSHNIAGITLSGRTPYNNLVYHNDIIYNVMQASDKGSANNWDNGYPSGGNYWSDYTGVDNYSGVNQDEPGSDGIGDTPYPIYGSAGSQDRYPLMRPVGCITATIDIDPDTLNMESKGLWITCYIELPESYDVADIDVSTRILNDVVGAEPHPTEIGDYDDDGIADLMVKFDRAAMQGILQVGDVEITVTGELTNGTPFEGTDTIRVID